ncbi:MAG: phosphotransferase [Mycobacterium sp.]|nr:phosphotransferase [Mycobacterium sp.]
MAAIHRVRFPAPLQGKVGPTSLVLRPCDPVDALTQELDRSRAWITTHHAGLIDVLERLISAYAEQIRADQPCLLHNDTTFDNFVVTDDAVRPIDWDLPAVGYPLAELANLDQQAYLYGSADGLPAEFWHGYGRTYPPGLLLIYRAMRCISLLASPCWATWEADPAVSEATKAELRRRHELHKKWTTTLPTLLQHADP